MITLDDLFSDGLFDRMLDEKYVRQQYHPSGELAIVNYTEKAQYDRMWNDVTLNCRGLIYHVQNRTVIARGFKKFFNWDDSSQPYPPTGPVIRAPKMDGSLGIMYWQPQGGYAIATRGSFTSDQALWASQALWSPQWDWSGEFEPKRGRSYLFEIIYPENRIVVNYGDAERLVLLDVLETDTGKSDLAEFDEFYWLDKVVKTPLPGFVDTMASDIPSGEEGFVFYWPGKDFRVKMKAAEYIELHRMIFGLNARTVWERMGAGESVESIAIKLPDEFYDWVRDIASGLTLQAKMLTNDIRHEWIQVLDKMPMSYTRKDFAAEAIKSPLKGYLFMLEDNKDISDAVWQSIKPAGGITFSAISEDVA